MKPFNGVLIAALVLCCPLLCIADDFGLQDLRCDGGLISVGAGKNEVLQSCGKPTLRQEPSLGLPEIWTYNFGPTDFVYSLSFEEGVLSKIIQGDRGY